MKYTIVAIDSEVFGGNVVSIEDFSAGADFAAFERDLVSAHDPVYAFAKVPLERVADVHALEENGFKLIECQVRSCIDLNTDFDTSSYPYRFERVTTQEALDSVLEIAGSTFAHDRISIDPLLDKSLSGERYRRYVVRSFSQPEEAVYRLFDPQTNKTVGFKTHKYLPNQEVLFLLGGVRSELRRLGLGVINSYCEFSVLRGKGIRRGYTHISASNYDVFNVEIGKLRFQVLTSYAVFRKIYGSPSRIRASGPR